MNEAARSTGGVWRVIGYVLFGIGAATLMGVRGCGALQKRAGTASFAKYRLAQAEFQQKWDEEKADLQRKLRDYDDPIDQKPAANNDWQERNRRRAEINKDLEKVRKDEREAREDKERGDWKDLKRNSQADALAALRWGYLRQWILIPGVAVLAIGLVLLAIFGNRQETWLSLMILGVLVYSLFVGGELWADSQFDNSSAFILRGM